MNDPLGLFDDEEKGSDPLGLFSDEEKKPSRLNKVLGAGEAALNIGSGLIGQIPAGIGTILDTVNELTQGRHDPKKAEQRFQDLSRAFTYEPRTEEGKQYVENIMTPDVVNTLNALGGVAHTMPPARTGPSVRSLIPKETPIPESRLDKLNQLTQPKETVASKQDPLALFEGQGELDLFSTDQKQLGQSPFDAVGGKFTVDENGIPIKQMLSEEVSRTADEGVQGRLFEDPAQPVDPVIARRMEEQAAEKARLAEEQSKQLEIEQTYKQRDEANRQRTIDEEIARRDEILMKVQEELSKERVSKGQQRKAERLRAPRGQRGAIDAEAVKEMTDFFKRGMASARDLLDTWKGAFTENELGVARKAIDNPKSLDTVVFMTPDEFHNLATMRTPGELNAEYTPRLRDSIKEGLQSKGGLWEIPYLRVDNEGQVTAHEGRHRMDVFKEQGYELVPVRLRKEAGEGWGTWKTPSKIIPQDFKDSPPSVKQIAGGAFPEIIHAKQPVQLPKSQRGGLDIKEIGEGVKKLVKSVVKDDVKADKAITETPKQKALNDLPGMEKSLEGYIPPDPTASEILTESLGAGDSNLKMTGVQSGATLTGIKYNSPLISGIGRLYQNAQKRSEKAIRDWVYPVEYSFKKLNRNEIIELSQVMKKEMLDGVEITADKLREAGYSDKQIKAYTELRDLLNKTYEAQAKALEAQGKKVPTKREAYLSSRWNGDWHVPVYTKEGKLVYYIAEQTRSGANAALRYLEGQFDIDKSKSKVEYRQGFSKRGSAFDAYQTMLSLVDKSDPRAQAIKSVMEDAMINDAFSALNQKKHFENKANVRGFLGDRPWKNDKTNAYDLFKSQFDYAKNAFTWTELQKATNVSKEVLSNEWLAQEQPNNLHYAQQYAKNKLGFGDANWVTEMENTANKMLGTSKQQFYNVVGDMKSFFIIQKLGLNLGFMAANMIQPVFTLPWHANLVSQGIKHNPLKTFTKGGLDSVAGYGKYSLGLDLPMTQLGEQALKYAEDNGIVRRSMFDETANIGRHPGIELAEKVGSTSIQSIEHMARLNAFMGYVHHLDQSSMYKDMSKLFEKAEELTNASMVDYRQGEGAMVFDKAGLTGEALKTLQTFKFNYYNQLHYFLKEANEGRPSALMTFVGLQAMLGGALGLPFMQEIDDIFNFLKENAPTDVHQYIKDFSPKQKLIETLPDWASYGGLSKLTGANFSSRFDSGNLADLSLDGLFPFVSDIANQVTKVGKAALDPSNTTKQAEALYSIAPPGPAQGLLETGMDAFKGPATNEGKQVYLNPKDLGKQDANFVRTPEQENYRKFGLTQLDEAKYKDLRFRQNKNEMQRVERRNELATKYFDAVIRGEKKDVEKYMYQYVRYDGDPQTLIDRLDDDMVRRRLPAETIQAMRAQSLTAVQKAKRMKEILNGYNK